MDLDNNGGVPERDNNGATDPLLTARMSPSPPSSLLSFRDLITQGKPGAAAYLLHQLGGVPAGRFQSLGDQSPWSCLCGGAEHVQRDDGGDNPADGRPQHSAPAEMEITTVRGSRVLFPDLSFPVDYTHGQFLLWSGQKSSIGG